MHSGNSDRMSLIRSGHRSNTLLWIGLEAELRGEGQETAVEATLLPVDPSRVRVRVRVKA